MAMGKNIQINSILNVAGILASVNWRLFPHPSLKGLGESDSKLSSIIAMVTAIWMMTMTRTIEVNIE